MVHPFYCDQPFNTIVLQINHLYFDLLSKCPRVAFDHFLYTCSKVNSFVMKPETKRNQKKKRGELEIKHSRTNNKLQNTKSGVFQPIPFQKSFQRRLKFIRSLSTLNAVKMKQQYISEDYGTFVTIQWLSQSTLFFFNRMHYD